MSIAAALNSAASGLSAVSRGTEVVAGNVANAMTPGYARRQVVLTAMPEGGVRIASVERIVQAALVGDARRANAALGASETIATFHKAMETTFGVPGDGTALADRVSDLDAALISAASRPDNEVRLGTITKAASDLVADINSAGEAIQSARTDADRAIAADVDRIRTALTNVARLNKSIIIERANSRDTATLMDERQRALDDISSIVPIREVPRDHGRVAVFTAGGATLLDGTDPIDLTFAAAGRLTPSMHVGTAPVSRLVLDGAAVGNDLMPLFAGGSLEANFAIRDRIAPEAQAGLDAFAQDLMERFSDPTVDSTVSGAKGIFLDGATGTSTGAERGLANRLTLNPVFAEDGSGDWHWRDGVGATSRGEVGRATLLTALAGRLSETRSPASAAISAGSRTTAGFAAELSSRASSTRLIAESNLARDSAHASALQSEIMSDGVDTDAEMQRLLDLERAYAANAKIIQAADAMISRILEL